MKLLSLKINNLFSIDEAEVSLADQGLVLVSGFSEDDGGSNGSGKTSLINRSLSWALFGISSDGLLGDDVVNQNSGRKKAWAEVEFSYKNADFKIVRQRNPSSLSFYMKEANQWLNVSLDSHKNTQEFININLNRSFNTFVQTDLFGQGKQIPYPSLSPLEQRGVLENILPISELEYWGVKATEARKRLESLITIAESTTHTQGNSITETEANRKALIFSKEKWDKENSEDLEKLRHGLLSIQEQEASVKAQKDSLVQQLKELGPEEDTTPIVEDRNKLGDKNRKLVEEADQLYANEAGVNRSIVRFQAKVKKISQNTCPTCGSEISIDKTNELIKEQEEISEKISSLRDIYALYTERLDSISFERQEIDEEIVKTTTKLNEFLARNEQRRQLQLQISTLNNTRIDRHEIFEAHIKRKLNETNPFLKNIEILDNKLFSLGKKKTELEEHLKALCRDERPIAIWEKAFKKDLKTALFSRACNYLNSRISTHLIGLNNQQLHAKFVTIKELKSGDKREELNVQCWSDNGGKNFSSLSGGEKQIISFAIGLALADLAETQVESRSNVMILDEPFLYLDPKNCENIVSYLSDHLSTSRETIFLISNEDNLRALIPNSIHVIKEKGISRVEQQ
jgi:DNA repair exonuclease SbcCD ATPase subunit